MVWIFLIFGCETYKFVDLADDFHRPKNEDLLTQTIEFTIDTVLIRHTKGDLLDEPNIYHQNLNIGLKITVINSSSDAIEIQLNHSDEGVYAFLSSYRDTLKFTTGTTPSSLSIKPCEKVKFSMGNQLYNFRALFGKKKDYSNDMLRLIERLRLVYKDDQRSSSINFREDVQIYSVNRK